MAVKERLEEIRGLYRGFDVASIKKPETITLNKFKQSYFEDDEEDPVQERNRNTYAAEKFVPVEEKHSTLPTKVRLVRDRACTVNSGSESEGFFQKEKQEKVGPANPLEDYEDICPSPDVEEYNEVQTLCINFPHPMLLPP